MGALRLKLPGPMPAAGTAMPVRMSGVTTEGAAKINEWMNSGVKNITRAIAAFEEADADFSQASEAAKEVDNKNAEDFAWDAAGEAANYQNELQLFRSQLQDGIRYIKERRLGSHEGFTHRKA